MFVRKIAATALVALTIVIAAGCNQVLDLVGLGSKSAPIRQPKVSNTLAPLVEATADPPVFYSPAPIPTASWAYATPRPTPAGPVTLTAKVIDLGQGLREIVPDLKHCKGCLKDPIYYDQAILMDCAVDDAGRVYLTVHSVSESIGMYFVSDMDSLFRLDELTDDKATFSRVATSSGGISSEAFIQGNVGRIRHDIFREFVVGLLPSPAATAPLDVVYAPVYDRQSGGYNAYLLRTADNTAVILSADGEEKWGQRELTLDGLPENSWDIWRGLPKAQPFERQTFSVGYNSAVALRYDGGIDPSQTLVRVRGKKGPWRDLTGTGTPPVDQNLATGVGVDYQQVWQFYSTEFSPRWRAHFMWAGRYWGRVLLYLDNP